MNEFMNEVFESYNGVKLTVGRNYADSTEYREGRAVYFHVTDGAYSPSAGTALDLAVAKRAHEHLGAVIRDIEAGLERQRLEEEARNGVHFPRVGTTIKSAAGRYYTRIEGDKWLSEYGGLYSDDDMFGHFAPHSPRAGQNPEQYYTVVVEGKGPEK